jgi:hypothetical protein
MSDTVRTEAAKALEMVEELNRAILPEPVAEVVPYESADPRAPAPRSRSGWPRSTWQHRLDRGLRVLGAGRVAADQPVHAAGCAQQGRGPAGDSLRQIVTTIRGFSVSELDVRRKRSWWEMADRQGRAHGAQFAARYENVQGQIDRITENLLSHEHKLHEGHQVARRSL